VIDALEVARAAIAAAGDEADAVVLCERSGLARFAGSEVHQPTLVDNTVVSLRVVDRGKVGVAATNRIDGQGLGDLVARARAAAASAVADEHFPGLAAPAEPPAVAGWDEATAGLTPDEQAVHAARAIDAVGMGAYGFFTSAVTEVAVASTTGVAVSQRMTDATTLVVAADENRSGYAEASSWRVSDLDPAAVAREAAERAERTGDAAELEPGRYGAVLEPYALAVLLEYFGLDSFGAEGLLDGRSYLDGRLGARVFDEKMTVVDDALDPRGLPKSFDFEGVPKQRVTLIEDGVARGLVWDRLSAARAADGHVSTGHAPPAGSRGQGPLASALAIGPGTAESTAELAELVGDGIYVTRLHYLGVVDPRAGIITGMTRDGTFRVRNGRIAEPLVNLRFTVSVPELLADVPGLTRELKLVNGSDFYGERYATGALVPALATASFNVTGVGSRPGL
jgi:predicted Zn-dependent protease